ncbi:MAG TPA: RNA polymerase sigma factor [Pyrinomonadaceae bacterium]|jgi:RNA polymerase sigma-70 factor (ECF subfamily)
MSEASANALQQFDENCAEYHDRLFRYVLRLTGNVAVAEDITQAAFLRFLQHMKRKQWEMVIKSVPAYLIIIAVNLCKDMWKSPWGEEGVVSYDDEENEQIRAAMERKAKECDDSAEKLENRIHFEELYNSLPLHIILGDLTEYESELLTLNAIDELSPDEIAPIVGKEVCQVRYHLQRLYAKLRYRARTLLKETGGKLP